MNFGFAWISMWSPQLGTKPNAGAAPAPRNLPDADESVVCDVWPQVQLFSSTSARTIKRFPSRRCASAIQIVRPLESIAEIQPQLRPAGDMRKSLCPLRLPDFLHERWRFFCHYCLTS